MNTTVKNVALVISADDATTQRILDRAAPILAENRWQADVIQVTPEPESSHNNVDGNRRKFSSLNQALRAATANTIILLDDNPLIDADQWGWAEKRLVDQPIQCLHGNAVPNRGIPRLLTNLYGLLARLMLKHGANEFTPTVILIDNHSDNIDEITAAIATISDTDKSGWRFISATKTNAVDDVAVQSSPCVANSRLSHRFPQRASEATSALKALGQFWFSDIMFPRETAPYQSSRSKRAADGTQRVTARLARVMAWGVLMMLALTMLGSQLSYPLFEPDETRNAQLALNVIESGDWMSLQLQGQHYWDKPPLTAWMTATAYRLFGVSETSTRLPCGLMIATCVMMVCFLGKRLVGFRAAWIASVLMLLCCGMPFAGRYLTMDAALTLCVTVVGCSIYIASFGTRFRKHWWVIAGIFTGVGLLAKGPVILVLTVPPIVLFAWMTNKSIFPTMKSSFYWAVPCFLIAAPWYLATVIGAPEFLEYFFWKHHVVRFTAAFDHQEPTWYYLPIILVVMFPASQLFLPLFKFAGTRKSKVRCLRTKAHGFLVLFAFWPVAFFSLSQAKLPTYIFPAIPAICLLFGSMLEINVFSKLKSANQLRHAFNYRAQEIPASYRRLPKWFAFNLTAWIILTSIAIGAFLPNAAAPISAMCASAILMAVLTAFAAYRRSHPTIAWIAVGGLAFFMSSLIVNRIIPAVSTQRSILRSVAEMKEEKQFEDAEIVYFARDDFGTQILLPEETITHFPETEFDLAADYLQDHTNTILVSTPDHIKQIRKILPWKVRIQKQTSARHVYLISAVEDEQLVQDDQPSVKTAKRKTEKSSAKTVETRVR